MRNYKFLQTSMITKYPESKEMRGIMKCYNKEKSKIGYKLQYKGELVNQTASEVLKSFIEKEKKWSKNRETKKG